MRIYLKNISGRSIIEIEDGDDNFKYKITYYVLIYKSRKRMSQKTDERHH